VSYQGQEFTQRWEEPVNPSDCIEVRITVEQLSNKEKTPEYDPSEYLKHLPFKYTRNTGTITMKVFV